MEHDPGSGPPGLLAEHRIDFRRGLDGLLAEASRLGGKPYDGDCVVFVEKDRTQLRALMGDSRGLLSPAFVMMDVA